MQILFFVLETVLDKTLKGIRDVQLNSRKVLRAPGLKTKYFKCFFFCLINYILNDYLKN